jgi:hypothetical protein
MRVLVRECRGRWDATAEVSKVARTLAKARGIIIRHTLSDGSQAPPLEDRIASGIAMLSRHFRVAPQDARPRWYSMPSGHALSEIDANLVRGGAAPEVATTVTCRVGNIDDVLADWEVKGRAIHGRPARLLKLALKDFPGRKEVRTVAITRVDGAVDPDGMVRVLNGKGPTAKVRMTAHLQQLDLKAARPETPVLGAQYILEVDGWRQYDCFPEARFVPYYGNNGMTSLRIDHAIRTVYGPVQKLREIMAREGIEAWLDAQPRSSVTAYLGADGAGTFTRYIASFNSVCQTVFNDLLPLADIIRDREMSYCPPALEGTQERFKVANLSTVALDTTDIRLLKTTVAHARICRSLRCPPTIFIGDPEAIGRDRVTGTLDFVRHFLGLITKTYEGSDRPRQHVRLVLKLSPETSSIADAVCDMASNFFDGVKLVKPLASNRTGAESYLVCHGLVVHRAHPMVLQSLDARGDAFYISARRWEAAVSQQVEAYVRTLNIGYSVGHEWSDDIRHLARLPRRVKETHDDIMNLVVKRMSGGAAGSEDLGGLDTRRTGRIITHLRQQMSEARSFLGTVQFATRLPQASRAKHREVRTSSTTSLGADRVRFWLAFGELQRTKATTGVVMLDDVMDALQRVCSEDIVFTARVRPLDEEGKPLPLDPTTRQFTSTGSLARLAASIGKDVSKILGEAFGHTIMISDRVEFLSISPHGQGYFRDRNRVYNGESAQETLSKVLSWVHQSARLNLAEGEHAWERRDVTPVDLTPRTQLTVLDPMWWEYDHLLGVGIEVAIRRLLDGGSCVVVSSGTAADMPVWDDIRHYKADVDDSWMEYHAYIPRGGASSVLPQEIVELYAGDGGSTRTLRDFARTTSVSRHPARA